MQRRVWTNRRRRLRYRWPVYLMMLLFCLLGVAILILAAQALETSGTAPALPTVLG